MEALLQWGLGLSIMAVIGLVIIWDHRVTKREERERREAEQDE